MPGQWDADEDCQKGERVKPAKKEAKNSIVLETDLSSITRCPDRFSTIVEIDLGWSPESGDRDKFRWLTFGECELRVDGKRGSARLEAHLKGSTCDFEHDTAWALKLPLIGLKLDEMGVWRSRTHFTAWVDPDAGGDMPSFHVPRPGYNPMAHKDIEICDGIYDERKKKYCKWNEGKKHIIVPEGFYVPPFDAELYEAVRGKRVEISTGPALKDVVFDEPKEVEKGR